MMSELYMEQEIFIDETAEQEPLVQSPPELTLCLIQLNEWKDRCARLGAEFENYKKREARERQQWDYFAQKQLLLPLLSIIDNFRRAYSQSPTTGDDVTPWIEGMNLIAKELDKYLERIGLQPIAENSMFDPALHEAVMQENSSDIQTGMIITVLEPGYRFKGHVLRPAKVSVAT